MAGRRRWRSGRATSARDERSRKVRRRIGQRDTGRVFRAAVSWDVLARNLQPGSSNESSSVRAAEAHGVENPDRDRSTFSLPASAAGTGGTPELLDLCPGHPASTAGSESEPCLKFDYPASETIRRPAKTAGVHDVRRGSCGKEWLEIQGIEHVEHVRPDL